MNNEGLKIKLHFPENTLLTVKEFKNIINDTVNKRVKLINKNGDTLKKNIDWYNSGNIKIKYSSI